MAGGNNQILRLAVPVPLRRTFDYHAPKKTPPGELQPGIRIRVPFGKTKPRVGLLLETTDASDIRSDRLKTVLEVLDQEPLLNRSQLNLLIWASDYYHHPLGEAIFSTLPGLLRQGNPAVRKGITLVRLSSIGREFNPEELSRAPKQRALLRLLHDHLEGITTARLKEENFAATARVLMQKGLLDQFEQDLPDSAPVNALSPVEMNPRQRDAAARILAHQGEYRCFLLDGVTGSGKTEVYIEVIKGVIAAGRQALLLVPEIGLTPQIVARLRGAIPAKIVVLHSSLSDSERLQAWLEARDGTAAVILGTRSAIWTPLRTPGAIIIDEEHDLSYKQQDGFRYSARDVAIMRGSMDNIPVVLGSATPSMESLHNVNIGKFTQLLLPQRAGNSVPPLIRIIDLRNRPMNGALSDALVNAITQTLEKKQQALLFLNRRGFSPVMMCHHCGWAAKCQRCDLPMTFHKLLRKLACHHCDSRIPVPQQCPECQAEELLQIGHGTERLSETLKDIFPQATILRIDRDSTRVKGSMQKMIDEINSGAADILIGTQMLAKGHHFSKLTLVGIVDADRGLFSADFRTSERMAQLYIQVSGRAGREDHPGNVMIQTHFPTHPLLQSLVTRGYNEFARVLLEERKLTNLPPFSYLAMLRVEDYHINNIQDFLKDARSQLKLTDPDIEIFGPIPAPMEKRAGRLRFQLLLQAADRNLLKRRLLPWCKQLEELASGRRVRWSIDVDPQDMI